MKISLECQYEILRLSVERGINMDIFATFAIILIILATIGCCKDWFDGLDELNAFDEYVSDLYAILGSNDN